MNVETRELFSDAERAVACGDLAAARTAFVEAGDAAAHVQLWRGALRCYRHALELDLLDRASLDRILRLPARVIGGRGWDEYRAVIDTKSHWPPLGCRHARVVIGDLGAFVECSEGGPVLELVMRERDLVETRPDGRFRGMPIAMSLVILRRAMWPVPPARDADAATLRVAFEGRQQVLLDALGDWQPILRR